MESLRKAGEANAELEGRKQNRAAAVERVQRLREGGTLDAERSARVLSDAKAAHERAVTEANAALERANTDAKALQDAAKHALAEAERLGLKLADAPPLPDPVDTAAISQRIAAARATNAELTKREQAIERRALLGAEAVALEESSREITARMDARAKQKQDAIAGAAMPVDGLGFGAGVVTYNGVPFDQASSAEQLRVSMGIAIAANPKLRVIRITDGSLLDEDSLAAIGEMAKAADFQVFVEVVDSSGTVGIVIEDGLVASTPESREAAESGAS